MRFLVLLSSLFSLNVAYAGFACSDMHAERTPLEAMMRGWVDVNLHQAQANGLAQSAEAIQQRNQKMFEELNQLPQRRADLKQLSKIQAQALISRTRQNAVTRNQYLYERPEAEIGYCFGRATFVHLEALRLGYKEEQIKKIWVVGSMVTGNIRWGYHVATMIRSKDGKWWVIDTFTGKAQSPKEWFAEILPLSEDGKLHVYLTEPEKFTPYAGKYSRLHMGIGEKRELDYYKGYFPDLYKELSPKPAKKIDE